MKWLLVLMWCSLAGALGYIAGSLHALHEKVNELARKNRP